MYILAIESSCDDTAAAVTDGRTVAAALTASQVEEHVLYGGVVPEIAYRRRGNAPGLRRMPTGGGGMLPGCGECLPAAGECSRTAENAYRRRENAPGLRRMPTGGGGMLPDCGECLPAAGECARTVGGYSRTAMRTL